MIFNDTLFQALCFFTLGFLCLIGFISFCLNYYFKSKAYGYYFLYIISTILFVISTFVKYEKPFGDSAVYNTVCNLSYDILRVVVFYFHSLFIYKSMVLQIVKFKKLNRIMNIYTVIVCCRIIITITNPSLMDTNPIFFTISRILVFGVSLVFYYFLFKYIANNYFKFLFLASTILIITVFLSIIDASINKGNSTFLGIISIFTGITLDNICFVAAFTYQIITIDREKKNAEITHKEQLSTVQFEMQQQTMQHIGREIHDNVGQKLTLASLYTQQLAFENKAPLIKNTIENIIDSRRHIFPTVNKV